MQEKLGRLLRNRGGAVIAGAVAALLAVILLILYLHSYRASVNSGKQTERVLVATKLIQRGTSGDVIAKEGLYQVATVQKDQLKLNAIGDPAVLNDRVAAADIFPGQQITQNDFTTESVQSIPFEITGKQRAIAIPVDATHGLIGQIAAGNYVDIYVGVTAPAATTSASTVTTTASDGDTDENGASNGTIVTLLAPNVYVLVPPGAGSGDAIIRIDSADAAKFAYAADNARIWLVLRPQTGATPTPPETATLGSLLANVNKTAKTG